MAYYGRREDVGARTMRFDYMDRIEEEEQDQVAAAQQKAEAYKRSLSPIEPDQVLKLKGGEEVSVFLNGKSQQIRDRLTQVARIHRGESR